MTILEAINDLDPILTVWADPVGVMATAGSLSQTDVQIIPGLDDRVLRMMNAEVVVSSIPDFTEDRRFTMMLWFRGEPHTSTRRLIGRQNGSTWVTLDVGRDGIPVAGAASTAGGYRITAAGRTRVDDGNWHLLAVRGRQRHTQILGVTWDSGGMALDLWHNTELVRQSNMDPGTFGTTPNMRMTTPIILGRAAAGGSSAHGDIGPVAVLDYAVTAAGLATVWEAHTAGRGGFTGWGIQMG